MARAAIKPLAPVLAMEPGPHGIAVDAVAPGWVRTGMNAASRDNDGMVEAIEAETAPGRFGETAEIASAVAFPAADASLPPEVLSPSRRPGDPRRISRASTKIRRDRRR